MKDRLIGIIYKENEPLDRHTTFRIGGPARFFVMPKNVKEIVQVVKACKETGMKYMLLGNGSNVLFMDEGYDGVVIQIGDAMNKISIDGQTIYAEAGAMLGKVAMMAKDASLTGMEFAAGIPGTIGGAIVMNAGAYGGEMKDIVVSVDVLDEDGMLHTYSCEEMQFGYRTSRICGKQFVVGITIDLRQGHKEDIIGRMDELKNARISKQPLEYPSAGSTFRRPEGYFAGKLIEDAGLRGFSVGGAMVSEKHCGFVINYNHATAKDVLALIDFIQRKVYDTFQVTLEPEVKIIQ